MAERITVVLEVDAAGSTRVVQQLGQIFQQTAGTIEQQTKRPTTALQQFVGQMSTARTALQALGGDAVGSTRGVEQLGQIFQQTAGTIAQQIKSPITALQQFVGQVSTARTALLAFSGVVASLGVARVANEFLSLAQTAQQIEGQLRLVTTSTEELTFVQNLLFDVAQRSRGSFEATVDLYARLARSTKDLGVSQEELALVTETVNQAIVVSGASAMSAQAALFQLGQALASGALRGDELNSVLEQTPRVAQAIAAGMGVTIGELRKLGAEGRITAQEVIQALLSQGQAVRDEFAKMPVTVGQATTQVSNAVLALVSDLDKAVGVSSRLAIALQGVADALTSLRAGQGMQEAQALTTVFEELSASARQSITLIRSAPTLGIDPAQSATVRAEMERLVKVFAELQDVAERIRERGGAVNLAGLISPLERKELAALFQEVLGRIPALLETTAQKTATVTEEQKKAQEEAQKLIERLKEQVAIFGQGEAAQAAYAAASLRARGATAEQAATIKALGAQLEHLKTREEETKRRKKELADADALVARNASALAKIRLEEEKALEALNQQITQTVAANNEQVAIIERGIAAGRHYDDILRDLAIAQKENELTAKGMTEGVHAAAVAMVDSERAAARAREGLRRMGEGALLTTRDLETLADGILAFGLRGRDLGDLGADLGVALGTRLVKGILFGKAQHEHAIIGNFNTLLGIPAQGLFSQLGAGLGTSLIGGFGENLLTGFEAIFRGDLIGAFGQGGAFRSAFFHLGKVGAGLFGFGLAEGVKSLFGFGRGSEASIGGGVGGLIGGIIGNIIAPGVGGFIGSFLGDLFGSFLGGLFAHTPTRGTQIRKGTVEFLKEIGASFANEIKSGNYFFEATKALAKAQFGGDFLAASKQILRENAGPELAKELTALGTFLTSESAGKLGKSLEQTGTTFGNLLVANLGIDRIPAAMDEIMKKAGISFTDVVETLNAAFEQGRIGVDFYQDAIKGAVTLFTKDLPAGIDVAKVAMKSFTDDGIFSLEKFRENLTKTVDQAKAIGEAFAASLAQGIASNQSRAEVEANFEKLMKDALRSSLITRFVTEQIEPLFKDIDLTEPIDLSSEAFQTLRARVGDAYDALVKLLDAAGLLPDEFDQATNSAERLVDEIKNVSREIEALLRRQITIRVNLAADLARIGAISPIEALNVREAAIRPEFERITGTISPIGTRPFINLSNEDLQRGIELTEAMRDLTLQRFELERAAIEANLQREIRAIQAAFAARREALQQERRQVQELFQARLEALRNELAIAQEFQRLTQNLQQSIDRLVIGPQSALSGTQQLAFLQRRAADLRKQIAGAEGSERAGLMQQLADILQQQLGLGVFQRPSAEFQRQFRDIVGELERLREAAAKEGAKAEDIQKRILETELAMKASLASIDAALAALPAQEAAAINAAQDRADAAIATLREATVDRLKFLADLETQLVQEQIARAEERRQRLVKDLEDLVGPDRAAALIANANAGLVVELARLNQTLMDLNTILRAIPSAQGGLGPLPRDQLVFAHRGEVIGHPQQIGTSTSITIAPNINVTVQGTQNPQRDGAEFGRAVASLLLEEFRRGKFGAEIRRELKR